MRKVSGSDQKEAWVEYHLLSGAVEAIHFRKPSSVKQGHGMVKTTLSEQNIQRPHHLKVVGERVFHAPSLAGI